MHKFVAALLVLPLLLGDARASEPPGDPAPIPGARYEGRPRGWVPPPPPRTVAPVPRYAEPAPRYYEPAPRYQAPRVQLGDTCAAISSSRACDLRRPEPIGSYCECVSPSGRVREGRVTR